LPDLAQTLITFASERGYDIGEETKGRPSAPEIMSTKVLGEGAVSSSLTEASLAVTTQSPANTAIALEDRVIQLAIMGRPNVGKSSLLNAFIGESRVIVGPTPGERHLYPMNSSFHSSFLLMPMFHHTYRFP